MRQTVIGIAWLSVVAVIVGFFLPWAKIDVREPGLMKQLRETSPVRDTLGGFTKDLNRVVVRVRRGAETVTGTLPSLSDIPRQVSGVQIPQMVNAQNAQVALALVELFTQKPQDLGPKSYAVYLLPGIALLCALLMTFFPRQPFVMVACVLLCAAIAGAGFWKLLTTNTRTLFIAITIGPGLWLSLWAYVALALAAGVGALTARSRA